MNNRPAKLFIELTASFIVALFLYTGISKLIDFEKFLIQLRQSPFVQRWAVIIAYALPVGEIITACLLIVHKTRLAALYISLFIMALFTGYVYVMLTYSYDLPCSCGGILEVLSWKNHLFFNAFCTLLLLIAIGLREKYIALSVN
jgi:cation transport ATPase